MTDQYLEKRVEALEELVNKTIELIRKGTADQEKTQELIILDKIRAEIMDTGAYEQEVRGKTEFLKGINYCLGIIDKYKTESEADNG